MCKVRATILDTAKECVCKDRNTSYGEPEDSFIDIAGYAACGGEIATKNQENNGEEE